MAIIVKTSKPQAILDAIYEAIDNDEVETWGYDKDRDFIHTPKQWRHAAWIAPKVSTGELRFDITLITELPDLPDPATVNGVYHGRFIEMLVTHFKGSFTTVTTDGKHG
jgi:hypothetical protein